MLYKLKENLPTIEIILGTVLYLYFIIEATFSLAVLWLIFIIYIWLFTSIVLEKYNLNTFINVLCLFGIFVSITLFFTSGIEELAYPEGALIFHIEGVTKALLLFFASSAPLIVINKKTIKNNLFSLKQQKDNPTEVKEDEKWEEATLDDLESGNFEAI
jgi:hypothetical protein